MKILFVGDITGQCGLNFVLKELPDIIKDNNIDFTICNAENASTYARGVNEEIFNKLISAGASCITLGNWIFGDMGVLKIIDDPRVIKPANIVSCGNGYTIFNVKGKRLLVLNLLGMFHIHPIIDINKKVYEVVSALDIATKILTENTYDYSIIDFHAEMTGEKITLAYYLNGLASAIIGTHTHVQSADERLLENGTLFITDVGMSGPRYSIIGADVANALDKLKGKSQIPKLEAIGKCLMGYVILDLENKTIERKIIYEE